MGDEHTKGEIGGMIAHFVDQAKGKIAYSVGFQTVGQIGTRFIQRQRANKEPTAEIISISPEEANVRATANNVGAAYNPRPAKRKKKAPPKKKTPAKKKEETAAGTNRPQEAF